MGVFIMGYKPVNLDKAFRATEDGETIFYVDYNAQMQKPIGITQKVADELTQALSNAIAKRDEYRAMLEAAGILQKEQTPEEIAKAAIEAMKSVQQTCESLKQENTTLRAEFAALLRKLGEVPETTQE